MDSADPPRKGPARSLELLSVVAPMLDEREGAEAFYDRVCSALGEIPFELVVVDDGSSDGTAEILDALAQSDARVRVLHLSRSFGHQNAITAGLDHASGYAVVMIDGDLQASPTRQEPREQNPGGRFFGRGGLRPSPVLREKNPVLIDSDLRKPKVADFARLADHEARLVPIGSLKPFGGNPRRGDVAAIRESLRVNGQYRPVVVRRETSEVLAGNHTLKAAGEEGWSELWATGGPTGPGSGARATTPRPARCRRRRHPGCAPRAVARPRPRPF